VLDAAELKRNPDKTYVWVNNDHKLDNGRDIDCRNEKEDVDQFEDEDGCPDPDNDRDTILDGVDNCPNDPEDFDQFEDVDGCPDKDNDKDGVLDAAELTRNPDGTYQWSNKDKKMENGVELDCRDRPEDFDKIEDEDGCPDVLIFDNCQIKLTDKIYFKFNKWDIDPKSFKLLDDVRDTLNAAPDIKVWIDGHTDSQGLGQVQQDPVAEARRQRQEAPGREGWHRPQSPRAARPGRIGADRRQQDRGRPGGQPSRRVQPQGLREEDPVSWARAAEVRTARASSPYAVLLGVRTNFTALPA
jgi:outer membrane protein OmpA-like peptidoglycan-associated protein